MSSKTAAVVEISVLGTISSLCRHWGGVYCPEPVAALHSEIPRNRELLLEAQPGLKVSVAGDNLP